MTKKVVRRLTRQIIVSAALVVAARKQEVTGRTVGDELQVDRSAIWRHFADRSELYLAVGDALLGEVSEEIRALSSPAEVLSGFFRGTMRAFRKYPGIGAALGPRSAAGEQTARVSIRLLEALTGLGIPQAELARELRTLVETTFACAASSAQFELLDEEARRRDRALTFGAFRAFRTEMPAAAEAIDPLIESVELEIETVEDTMLANYLAGLQSRFGAAGRG